MSFFGSEQIIACVEELCDAIATALNNPYCPITEKDLRDSQSSAHVLLAFVCGQIWSKYKEVSVQFSATFNHNALRSTFLSRLTSQDRIYDVGSFPIYIIHEMERCDVRGILSTAFAVRVR